MRKADRWRLYHIGDFFTDLALTIFGGEKTAGSHDAGDIDLWDTQLEVKGCSNRNSLKIYSDQLDTQVKRLGFPFQHLWYAIFFYRNQWQDRSRSLSKETPTRASLDIFLSQNIMCAFVVDARVLLAIRKVNGTKDGQRDNEQVPIIRMNKGTLHALADHPGLVLEHFKLRGFGVAKQKIRIKFRGSVVNFDLALILPRRQLRKVSQLNLDFSKN